ncbi:MAG: type II toxin-antitoxin system HicB family antitoxin [Actinomycetota bacterium]|nr:type II toxin-antitoxin system HicB family antitoxin [Actinomycetota bacterium]
MDLGRHVEDVHRQLTVAAAAGGEEARALAERLTAPLDAAIRLTLLDVLGVAAAEITSELAPGSVEVRLRGRDPDFMVTLPPRDLEDDPVTSDVVNLLDGSPEAGEAAMARINLRLPDQLKTRIERAADQEGLSINAWLVRAATAALQRGPSGPRRPERAPRGGQRYTGWVR